MAMTPSQVSEYLIEVWSGDANPEVVGFALVLRGEWRRGQLRVFAVVPGSTIREASGNQACPPEMRLKCNVTSRPLQLFACHYPHHDELDAVILECSFEHVPASGWPLVDVSERSNSSSITVVALDGKDVSLQEHSITGRTPVVAVRDKNKSFDRWLVDGTKTLPGLPVMSNDGFAGICLKSDGTTFAILPLAWILKEWSYLLGTDCEDFEKKKDSLRNTIEPTLNHVETISHKTASTDDSFCVSSLASIAELVENSFEHEMHLVALKNVEDLHKSCNLLLLKLRGKNRPNWSLDFDHLISKMVLAPIRIDIIKSEIDELVEAAELVTDLAAVTKTLETWEAKFRAMSRRILKLAQSAFINASAVIKPFHVSDRGRDTVANATHNLWTFLNTQRTRRGTRYVAADK